MKAVCKSVGVGGLPQLRGNGNTFCDLSRVMISTIQKDVSLYFL